VFGLYPSAAKMPLPERVIAPVAVSRNTLQFPVPDELEGVTNGTLANVIRQLSSLSRHAEEMFGNLFSEAEALAHRSAGLQARIDRLAVQVTSLDSTVEEGESERASIAFACRWKELYRRECSREFAVFGRASEQHMTHTHASRWPKGKRSVDAPLMAPMKAVVQEYSPNVYPLLLFQ